MKRLAILVLLGGGAILSGWWIWRWRRSLPEVRVVVVSRGALERTIQVEGVLHAVAEAEIAPEISGKILEVRVQEGDTVRRGDTLVVVDPSEYRARVLELEARVLADQARLRKLRREWERARALLHDSLVAPAEVEDRESEVRALEAQIQAQRYALEEARARLAKAVIRAPFDGVVLRVYREAGEQAVASSMAAREQVLMVLADLRGFYAEVWVDETEIPWIRPGMEAEVRVGAFPDRVFRGKVARIAGIPEDFLEGGGGEEGTLFPVRIRLEDRVEGLLPGMNLRARIVVQRREGVLRIPRAAIGKREGRPYVWRLRGGRVEWVTVRTGMRAEFSVEILDGLEAGDTVVVGPSRVQRVLKDGQPVRWTLMTPPDG